MDYSKGGRQGTATCRLSTGLLKSPHFLCSYERKRKRERVREREKERKKEEEKERERDNLTLEASGQ